MGRRTGLPTLPKLDRLGRSLWHMTNVVLIKYQSQLFFPCCSPFSFSVLSMSIPSIDRAAVVADDRRTASTLFNVQLKTSTCHRIDRIDRPSGIPWIRWWATKDLMLVWPYGRWIMEDAESRVRTAARTWPTDSKTRTCATSCKQ